MSKLFLGLDCSTQGFKCSVVDEACVLVHSSSLNFDVDLPHYGTSGGVHAKDGGRVTAAPTMWIEALQMMFDRLKAQSFPFSKISAICGSGQQHGSVYMKTGAGLVLQNMDPTKSLKELFMAQFAYPDSPIWQDSSTSAQCRALEESVGGPLELAKRTGSRAYERFTGNQIAKIYQDDRKSYDNCERICLVSSFLASVLSGAYVSIDSSDGSGMNLMDIMSRDWDDQLLESTAPELRNRLGPVKDAHQIGGRISSYFVEKYGFSSDCLIGLWSGDNPNSVAGLGLSRPGDVAVSLGTSDTLFGLLSTPHPGLDGHIFVNPVDSDGYMALLCYKNGSIAREHVRNQVASGSWVQFNQLLSESPVGNDGNILFYFLQPEITPSVSAGIHRYNESDQRVERFNESKYEVRGIVESQFLSMRHYMENIGLTQPVRILATGGASANVSILQVLADVFGVSVYTAPVTDSASLGAAYRAYHSFVIQEKGAFVPFSSLVTEDRLSFELRATPIEQHHGVYSDLLKRYQNLLATVISESR